MSLWWVLEVKGSQKRHFVQAATGFCGRGGGQKLVSPCAELHVDNVLNSGLAVAVLCSLEAFPPCSRILHGTARVKPVTSLSYCSLSGWSGSAAVTQDHSFWVVCRDAERPLELCWMLDTQSLEVCRILWVSGSCSFLIQAMGAPVKNLWCFLQSAQCNFCVYQPSANSNTDPVLLWEKINWDWILLLLPFRYFGK